MPSQAVITTTAPSISPRVRSITRYANITPTNAANDRFADTVVDVAAQRHPAPHLANALRGMMSRDREPRMLQKVEVRYK
jgi:hypothetical protein